VKFKSIEEKPGRLKGEKKVIEVTVKTPNIRKLDVDFKFTKQQPSEYKLEENPDLPHNADVTAIQRRVAKHIITNGKAEIVYTDYEKVSIEVNRIEDSSSK